MERRHLRRPPKRPQPQPRPHLEIEIEMPRYQCPQNEKDEEAEKAIPERGIAVIDFFI